MKLSPGFDPSKGCVVFSLECNLLSKYFEDFKECVETSPKVKGLEIERSGETEVKIAFPSAVSEDIPSTDKNLPEGMEMGIRKISVPSEDMMELNAVINNFLTSAIDKELKTTEFIPLVGYSWDLLRKDIKEAIKNKRDFCIIKDYDEFLNMQKEKYTFHQHRIIFGSEEYSDAAIMIHLDEEKKMNDLYTPQLELISWY